MASNLTLDPHLLEDNTVYTKNVYVDGNVYISGDLKIVDYPYVDKHKEMMDGLNSSFTITGDLYIDSDEVHASSAIAYTDIIIKSETNFNNPPIKNVSIEAKKMIIYGEIKTKKDITVYSDNVLTRIRNVKINNLKTNIQNKTYE